MIGMGIKFGQSWGGNYQKTMYICSTLQVFRSRNKRVMLLEKIAIWYVESDGIYKCRPHYGKHAAHQLCSYHSHKVEDSLSTAWSFVCNIKNATNRV